MRGMDLCSGSGIVVPPGGCVLCSCGQLWRDVPYVPLHDPRGDPQTAQKVAKSIYAALQAAQLRKDLAIPKRGWCEPVRRRHERHHTG